MSLVSRRRNRTATVDTGTDLERFNLEGLLSQVQYLGHTYPTGLLTQTMTGSTEPPDTSFQALVAAAYRSSGPVFACVMARGLLFSEARFLWQRLEQGRPGELFGAPSLALLEQPWPNGTTGELLLRAEQDVSLAGNFFLRHHRGRLWRLRPDWVTIVLGSQMDVDDISDAIDVEVVGYMWGRPGSGHHVALHPDEVAHWSPIPDPLAQYRGMSWLTPIAREIGADRAAVEHRQMFFDNAATPNLIVMPDATVTFDEFKKFKDEFRLDHEGAVNAYRTLFLGGGSTVQTVGLNMKDMDYTGLQGGGETRIASAARVPPIIAGFSEGLEAATYSNYGQARRAFADGFARPQWRSFVAAVAKLLTSPAGPTRLWYDDRDIAFLREDSGAEAEIRQTDAITIRQLVEAGYEPNAAVAYVETGQVSVLTGQHTGLTSVQLTPPGTDSSGTEDDSGQASSGQGSDSEGSGLREVDGLDPLDAAYLLQRLYLATPKKQVVSTEEARRLARRAGIDLDEGVPDELLPAPVPDQLQGQPGDQDDNENAGPPDVSDNQDTPDDDEEADDQGD